ncbi:unnamed protein product [Thlaspi arvense]|uniref:Serpin domain-containing protein n=1 Tax=Thlaspi arvense TaxID=13288 RepID=A0AAU9SI73_THLAR|nr:unnamed protein product [Thlaspi arvense]
MFKLTYNMDELGKSMEMQNDVAVIFAKHVIATVANSTNLVFSPTSINVLLCLIAAGSSSFAKERILSFLMLPSSDHLNAVLAKTIFVNLADSGERSNIVRFSAAYSVWIDKSLSFKPSYKELLDNSYKATSSQVDFASKPGEVIDEVNAWAKFKTNGVVTQIFSPNSIEHIRESKLILANAMYFKGSWSESFDAKLTIDYDFRLLDGTSVKVPFMTNGQDQYLNSYSGFQVLRLPYVKDHPHFSFSMYIYLPNDRDGLHALLEKISSKPGFLDDRIPRRRRSVGAFGIPKFKFSFEFEASDVLKDMGLTSPFTRGGSLTEMVDPPSMAENLYVSKILHKACIEVDEKGTEAAAVSVALKMVAGCSLHKSRKPDFVADHPFLFTVREDKSGMIMFMGQVLDPSKH